MIMIMSLYFSHTLSNVFFIGYKRETIEALESLKNP